MFFIMYPSKNTNLKMVTVGGQNMQEAYDMCNKIYIPSCASVGFMLIIVIGVWVKERGTNAITLVVFVFNPLNPELNAICYLLALLGAHHFLHVSRIRVKSLTFR